MYLDDSFLITQGRLMSNSWNVIFTFIKNFCESKLKITTFFSLVPTPPLWKLYLPLTLTFIQFHTSKPPIRIPSTISTVLKLRINSSITYFALSVLKSSVVLLVDFQESLLICLWICFIDKKEVCYNGWGT